MTLNRHDLRLSAAIFAACAIAFACGADVNDARDASVAQAEPTETSAAPAPTVTSDPPAPPTTAAALAIPDGAAVYQQYCAECHGADLRGTDKGPSQLSIIYEPNHHGDYAYRVAIRDGVREHHWWFGDMPPVEGITDLEIEKVISFVRSEQERLGFEE
ncbi:c-type cytochrome [Candidatus Poriferisodalis sp.]|uniref:c-type cytochrome n=1 Tax=Candidatus Poriferisodalis sp. TaxID=3101277 RepID=UPI003B0137A5